MMVIEKSFDTGEAVLNYAEGPDDGPHLLQLHGTARDGGNVRNPTPCLSDQSSQTLPVEALLFGP